MALQEDLIKLQRILQSGASDAEEQYQRLFLEINEKYTSPEEMKMINDFLINGFARIEKEAGELAERVKLEKQIAPYKDIIPLSYIARTYFGKSASWLSQRINGTRVRDKVYTLSKEDVEIFNHALQDISKKLGSLSISL